MFNVTDVTLVTGIGLMMIDIWQEGKREKALAAQEKARKGKGR